MIGGDNLRRLAGQLPNGMTITPALLESETDGARITLRDRLGREAIIGVDVDGLLAIARECLALACRLRDDARLPDPTVVPLERFRAARHRRDDDDNDWA